MEYIGKTGEYFSLDTVNANNCHLLKEQKNETLLLLWFTEGENELIIDGKTYHFNANEIVCLTQFHQLNVHRINEVKLMRFNRPFFCIIDHDSEVGCKGVLYYGAAQLPILFPDEMELEILETAWKMSALEFEMKDDLQLEMLQMMLKRTLILCTRIYNKQGSNQDKTHPINPKQSDLLREFNYLVEVHFRSKHTVADYAELLFKSPKTLSNTFKKLGLKSPIQLIQERLLLEARRLLSYTENDISLISDELGFNDIQSFSRFFKNQESCSPTEYRLSKK